ncbi:UDP-N-acetylmuramoyl-tripeptide--D-alanyl-D-alanine ligase [Marinisporobacter balticus]|uniref:UDP-N-acetylmuramoyl-tripeptide--D-alanyl-D-alanine ligase n=1 Tax=Marinisporobacter balticus TaxID=2018667 RepID=A0A4V2SCG9_9FIRM|nr:UDP-N-acetylmuramoyl-tripeptide--D-alanyl-D-alanine ligase [Marinisporobacter balticus]TCO79310.1 UDP-N-acetylmuramoyl-tripeptide--D-alanyl-D-alanine ligase [Marinisporobacter balticus]
MEIRITEVIEGTKGELVRGNSEDIIYGVSTDSRSIIKNELFIPLVGEKFNGHDYIENAVSLGAIAVITSEWTEENFLKYPHLNIIKVKDTLKALQDLAKYYCLKFNIPIIGVTGSTGKTSTKDMIYCVLAKKYKVLKNKGNFNNHIGLPLTALHLKKAHELAIFEMGMSSFGEIDLLAGLVKPEIAVITNVGLSHIEHLGSQENIMKAKMEITNYFDKKSTLVINGDDPLLKTIKDKACNYNKCFIGFGNNCNYQAINIKDLGEEGIRFDVCIHDKIYPFILNVPGEHNIYNALCAIAVGLHFHVAMKLIQEGIEEFKNSKMRLNVMTTNEKIKVINDAYNASPDSMRAALSVLRKMEKHRKIAILGDMLEMGEYAKQGHYDVGCEAGKAVDVLIAVGKDARYIANGAKETGMDERQVFSCKNNQETIYILEKILKEEDAVLVKGSRGMRMEEIVEYIQERS